MVTEVWFAQDIAQPIEVQHCKGVVFTNDNNGNKIGVRLFNGTAAYAPGGSVTCYVIRPDGVTVNFDGTVSSNALSATLPATALTVPGQISVVLQSVSGSALTTVFKGVFTCEQGTTGTIVAPSVEVSTLAELTANKVNKSGDTMTGRLVSGASTKLGQFAVVHGLASTEACTRYERTDTGVAMYTGIGSAGTNHGVFSYVKNGWMVVCDGSGNVTLNGTAENVSGTVAVANGGTGATTASGALTNLGYANTSFNQAGGTLAGALSSPGVWLVTVHDSANLANYWTGIGNRVSGANPTFVTIANNGISAPYGNTIGTVVFSGATGNYVARCVKIL